MKRVLALYTLVLGIIACGSTSGVRYVTVTGEQIGDELSDVTCVSSSHCIAVGQVKNYTRDLTQTLVEENTGNGWTIIQSPNVNTSAAQEATPVLSELSGVACGDTTHCVAVGSYSVSASLSKTLIEENNGGGWTIVSSPNPADWNSGSLSGVACTSRSHCIAVGDYEASDGLLRTLIEEDSGRGWTIVPSPNGTSSDEVTLGGVVCTNADRCIAFGSSGAKTMIQENTGRGWTIVPSPVGGLAGVSCPNPTYCIAIGFSENTRHQVFYTTHSPFSPFSGWSIEPAATSDGLLFGVTCVSDNYCVAIGTFLGGDTLVEENRGSGWQVLHDVPNSSLGRALVLTSIACPTAIHCIIVGTQYIGIGNSIGNTLIEEDNGIGWTIVSSPNVS
jgi:hypothetical protein